MKSIFESLRKTRNAVFGQIAHILGIGDIDAETWENLEAVLIQGDVGVGTSLALIERLRKRATAEGIYRTVDLQKVLHEELYALLPEAEPLNLPRPLAVLLIVGVNGSGKTTSIGKLTAHFKSEGRKVVLAAADTFRAAAMDQVEVPGAARGSAGYHRAGRRRSRFRGLRCDPVRAGPQSRRGHRGYGGTVAHTA